MDIAAFSNEDILPIHQLKTVEPSVEAERLKELLSYVEQVIRLDERPAFRLDEYNGSRLAGKEDCFPH